MKLTKKNAKKAANLYWGIEISKTNTAGMC